jgi:hypothetical protein
MKVAIEGLFAFAIFIALIGGCVWLFFKWSEERTKALQAIAQELKLQFFPKGDDRIAPLLANIDFFHYGFNCRVSNLMHGHIARGSKSVTVAIFDYQFTLGRDNSHVGVSFGDNSFRVDSSADDDDRQCFFQTVIVFYDENIYVPHFNLRPENFMDKIGNLVGCEDINFPDFPTFSKRYRLDSDRVDDVRALFQPNLLKFYEGYKLCTEANGNAVLIYPFGTNSGSVRVQNGRTTTSSSSIGSKEIKSYLDLGLRLLSLLERNLKEQLATNSER